MDMDEYQGHALKSVAITKKGTAALAHRTLGLTGEAGVLANQLKKVIRDKDSIPDKEDLVVAKKRLGDVLYYVAILADYFDLSLSEIAQQNAADSDTFLRDRKSRKK